MNGKFIVPIFENESFANMMTKMRGILRGIWMGGFGDNPKCDHGSKPWESHPPLKIRPRSRCEAKVSRDIHRQSSGDA